MRQLLEFENFCSPRIEYRCGNFSAAILVFFMSFEVSFFNIYYIFSVFIPVKGGAVGQSVERATPGEEVPGSIPAVAARSLLVGSVSV